MERREAFQHLRDAASSMMALYDEMGMPDQSMYLTDMWKAFEMLESAERRRAEIFARVRMLLAQMHVLSGDWAKGINAMKRLLDAQERMAALAKNPQPENRHW